MSIDPIIDSIRLSVSPEQAFSSFVDEFGKWWPAEYTWAGEGLEAIAIEPEQNGHCYELGPHQFRCDWGRVLIYDPPTRLVFTWQINPDRSPEPNSQKVSEVELLFSVEDNHTILSFQHRLLERHGSDAQQYRDGLASSQGWPYILKCYQAFIEGAK